MDKETARMISWCNNKGIRVYAIPVVSDGKKCKIAVEKNGRVKTGTEIYESKSRLVTQDVKTKAGTVKKNVQIPALNDKLIELYKQIYTSNNE